MLFRILTTGSAVLVLAVGVGSHSAGAQGAADDPGVKKPHAIQERVLALDAHDTSPSNWGSSENDKEEFDSDVIPRNQIEPARSLADVWRLHMEAKGKKGALAKIWSDDSLRVMDDVQKIATKLRKGGMLANDQAGPIAPNVLDAQPGPQPRPVPGTFWLALGLALIAVVVMLA